MRNTWQKLNIIPLGLAFFSSFFILNPAKAQISSDGTLSTNVNNSDNRNFVINQGNRVGDNLFHSFREFSVPTNGSAVFRNDLDVRNIINRVTGGSSNIDGLIKSQGDANLFLINPAGIFFGQNAKLEIRGSFFATTANSLLFNDGVEFSATDLQTPPLLSVNIPIGLRFRENPGKITIGNNRQTDLRPESPTLVEVKSGKTLALVGGEIELNGSRLRAAGGRIELGGLASAGTVGINNDSSLSFPDGVVRADVSLNRGEVDVTSGGGGSIGINARNIKLTLGNDICAGIGGDNACGGKSSNTPGSVESKAGDITLNATEDITGDGIVEINNRVNTDAIGNGGNINIQARSLSLTNGGQISASTLGRGNAGTVNIKTSDTVSLDGGENDSFILSDVNPGAVGNGGNINIQARSLSLTNGGIIRASTFGRGNAGTVNIKTSDTVSLDGGENGSFIVSNVQRSDAVGDSGGIKITTGSLSLRNGAQINSFTRGQGNSGNITIQATDAVTFDGIGSGLSNNVVSTGVGNSGGISIKTGSLFASDLAGISSSVNGRGNSGGIFIEARDTVSLTGVGDLNLGVVGADARGTIFSSSVNPGGVGNGGDIFIKTGTLRLDSSQINTSTEGTGNSGKIIIEARDQVALLQGSDMFTEVSEKQEGSVGGIGDGGDIRIKTGSLLLDVGANLRADTEARGNAGNITIEARDRITMSSSSDEFSGGIFAQVEPQGVGKGGNINITTGILSLSGKQEINTRTQGQGNAGDINIKTDSIFLANPQARIISGVTEEDRLLGTSGNGGNINITTGSLTVKDRAKLSANTETQDVAGNININASRLTLDRGSVTAQSTINADGGNINLNIRDLLLLRNGSEISTTAGTDGGPGNGGNIEIDTDLLVAIPSEDSDITSNSFGGKGGEIKINTQGLFGLEIREQSTSLSDITATSQLSPTLNGEITLNTPNVDPSQGLVELPQTVIDPDALIAQNPCVQGADSNFIVTGRGGLPPSPNQALSSEAVQVDLVEPVPFMTTGQQPQGNELNNAPSQKPVSKHSSEIAPAQGWIVNDRGEVVLTAYTPAGRKIQRSGRTSKSCPAR